MATTTRRYLSYPALAAGATYSYVSIGSFWGNGTWTTIVPANTITSTFYIAGLSWQFATPAANNTTYELLFDIGINSVVGIQFPVIYGNRSNVGYFPANFVTFPEPKEVAANTLINLRISSGSNFPISSGGVTGIKLFYQIV